MNIKLDGKRALVGGASGGIGLAITRELAACGAQVTLMARNEDKLKAAVAELTTAEGQEHAYIVTDFSDYAKHQAIMQAHFAQHEVDILVNNTNGPAAGGVLDKKPEDYQQAFELLFQHAVQTSLLALPAMQRKGYGRIINVASMTVKEPSASLVLSNTMRTALVSWNKSLATEVAKDGITANTVLTGFFDTDRLNSLMKGQAEAAGKTFEEVKAARIDSVPMKRLGDPQEYGYMVAFLASEYASFLTGTAIPLDGGGATALF